MSHSADFRFFRPKPLPAAIHLNLHLSEPALVEHSATLLWLILVAHTDWQYYKLAYLSPNPQTTARKLIQRDRAGRIIDCYWRPNSTVCTLGLWSRTARTGIHNPFKAQLKTKGTSPHVGVPQLTTTDQPAPATSLIISLFVGSVLEYIEKPHQPLFQCCILTTEDDDDGPKVANTNVLTNDHWTRVSWVQSNEAP